MTQEWAYPSSRASLAVNNHLRREGTRLGAIIDQFIPSERLLALA